MYAGEAIIDASRVQGKALVFDSFQTQAGRSRPGKPGEAGLQCLSAAAEDAAKADGQANNPYRTYVSTVFFYTSRYRNGQLGTDTFDNRGKHSGTVWHDAHTDF
jgi:hypothetical protein